ncbi:hypothetical protein [Streptomyces californicus]|uniref:hypothetical protein n=1 Tax=Streptomyces californicus TaxID=67351 RepID=UPI00296F2BAD|nr:hypothetical protein [Streptomyces californicus]MDW4917921.1 hypothetical protein [Streptomyces californicus]
MDAELSARFAAEVDWSKVVDPYTPWQHGPDLLERVWSPDARTADDAHADLHVACCGDGSSVLPAAVEVLPFLVRAAGDPDVRVRPQILDTLAVLGRAGNAARPTAPGRKRGGWRPTAPAAWPAAWDRATDALLPGLADGDEAVRAGVAAVLAQATGRADDLVDRLRSRFEDEPEQPVAEQLVLSVGELAPHAVNRRAAAVAWLRQRMDDVGKGEEPDIDQDVDTWIAWTGQHGHDVRLSAVTALRRALPGRPDPAYARTTVDALIRPSPYDAARFGGHRSLYVTRAVDADARLDEDLPGRLALARELLRQDSAAHHESGLRIAAALMSRWRSAVPELLPDVAEFVDGPDESNRSFALRVLAMCGTVARPWADRAAAHLSEDDEPYEPARRHAVWMLSRAGDERCVEPLIDGLSSGRATGFSVSPPYLSTCDWEKSDLNYTEALRPFAVRAEALLGSLEARGGVPAAADRDRRSSIPQDATERARVRWRETGDPNEVVHSLLELTANSARKAYATPGGVKPLLLLAEIAATHPPVADEVAGRLEATARARVEGDCRFEAMTLLRALWELTRDGHRVAPALVELVRICPPGGAPPTIVEAVELLAEVAAADPTAATAVAPRVRHLLDTDERPVRHDQWRAVLSDDALLAAVRTVVGAAQAAGA